MGSRLRFRRVRRGDESDAARGSAVTGKSIVAVGLLLVLVAPVLRFVVTPYLAQAPLSPGSGGFETQVSTGQVNAVLHLRTGVSDDPAAITQTTTTRGDLAAAADARRDGRNVGVYATLSRTVDADGRLLREENFQLAADRRTQALVDCCGTFVGGVVVPVAGAGNPLRFPSFTSQRTYPYFDTVLLTRAPMSFLGKTELSGFAAYKFQQSTTATPVGKLAVPGKLVGSGETTTTGERMYTVGRTVWVDPVTGIILRKTEHIRETLRDSKGVDVLTLYSADLDTTADQTAANIATARSAGRPLRLAHFWGPLLSAAAGLSMIAGVAIMAFRRRRAAELADDFGADWAGFDDLHRVDQHRVDQRRVDQR